MASIAYALERIKCDPLAILDRRTVERICLEHNYHWRDRELDPATTVALFVQQVLHGNTPCTEVRYLTAGLGAPESECSFTPQAYCQARRRLPLQIYHDLFNAVCDRLMPQTHRRQHLWRGHRTFHVDGSGFSMPDTPELRKAFGMPSGQKPGCGFPTSHLLVLFNAQTGLLLDAWASPLWTGDLPQMPEVHLHLDAGDILIGDDAFSTYAHLALLLRANLHGLFPVHHRRIVDFTKGRPHTSEGKDAVTGMTRSRWIKSLGKQDQLVEYFKPQNKPLWMSRLDYDALPDSIVVRELRRSVCRPGLGTVTLTIVTTLVDPAAYPAEELLQLRLRRWDVETDIRHLKTTMGLDVLRCRSEAGVRKELAVFCLVYNLVRAVMLEASHRQNVPVHRISFADALKWMRHARPGDSMPELIIVPYRPNRVEPRCKKRRPKEYDLMSRPRHVLRNRLKKQSVNA
jgi:Transposase DDE domain